MVFWGSFYLLHLILGMLITSLVSHSTADEFRYAKLPIIKNFIVTILSSICAISSFYLLIRFSPIGSIPYDSFVSLGPMFVFLSVIYFVFNIVIVNRFAQREFIRTKKERIEPILD